MERVRPDPDGRSRAMGRRVRAGFAAVGVCALSGCGLFGGKSGASSESVFSLTPGQCFQAPAKVQAQLSSLQRTSCTKGHTREAYAKIHYSGPGAASASTASTYPGPTTLSTFAKGACAERFKSYVGIDYLDSSLFFTYLFPSARSWEQDDDRNVICFVTTTGQKLFESVKGSKK